MRRCYLVCYDIADQRRLRRVFRVMKGYGEHWQYSIFFCTLRDIDRIRLQSELEAEMNLKEDQTLIMDLGAHEGTARNAVTALGKPLPQTDSRTLVI